MQLEQAKQELLKFEGKVLSHHGLIRGVQTRLEQLSIEFDSDEELSEIPRQFQQQKIRNTSGKVKLIGVSSKKN